MKALGWTLWVVVGVSLLGCGGEPGNGESDVSEGLQVGRMLGGDEDAEGFAQAVAPRPFRFPEDHGPHPAYRTEWWYLTFALEAIDEHATPFDSMEGAGAGCGPPAQLRLPSTLKFHQNAPAWRAGGPHPAPAPGAELPSTLELHHNAPAWRAGGPHPAPTPGAELPSTLELHHNAPAWRAGGPHPAPVPGAQLLSTPRLNHNSSAWRAGFPHRADTPGAREFGVQFTLFRRALIPGGDPADPWRNGQAYLAHFALTDLQANRHRHAERVARGHPELAGVEVADGQAAAWLEDWRLIMAPDGWSLRAAADGFAVDLAMQPEKGFVPQGDGGLSAKGPDAASHYYSAPSLRTRGHVAVDGRRHPVVGWGWLDREWSTSALSSQQIGWDWFALMLHSGEDVMAFRLRRQDGARDPYDHGAWIDRNGAARLLSASDFTLTPIGHWQDEEGRRWPVRWRLAVDENQFEIAAVLNDQRMDTLLTYWEGLVRVTDAQGRDAGRGYMELTGY